jgi:hypothetical protein
MPTSPIPRLTTIVAALLAFPALALETGNLQLKEGYIDPSSGLRIEKVVVSDKDQAQVVTVSLPQSAGTIDEVVVTAPEDKTPIKQKKRFEWLRIYFANEQANDQAGNKVKP